MRRNQAPVLLSLRPLNSRVRRGRAQTIQETIAGLLTLSILTLDGDPDPGEIVWTWVPYEEDHTQGKDRPVILVGRDGEYLLAFMMTSKDHNNRDHADSNYLDIGSGSWDSQGRASEVKLNRVLRVRPENMRREGAIMPQETFRLIEQAYNRR